MPDSRWWSDEYDRVIADHSDVGETHGKAIDEVVQSTLDAIERGDIPRPQQNLVAQLRSEATEAIRGTRRNRKASIRRDMEYLLDALAGSTILGPADPVFAQAIPLGDGRDKTLGLWTDADWQCAVNTRNRNVVEAGRAAAEFADRADRISDHIRRRGVLHTIDLFGEGGGGVMSELVPFDYEGVSVRTIAVGDGEFEVVAADVCRISATRRSATCCASRAATSWCRTRSRPMPGG